MQLYKAIAYEPTALPTFYDLIPWKTSVFGMEIMEDKQRGKFIRLLV